MKIIITLISILFATLSIQGQTDTVIFHLDQISAPAGTSQCIKLQADNFENIISAQLGFSWDTTLVKLNTIKDGVLKNTNYSSEEGVALFSWFDVLGISATPDEGLIELCFTSITDNTSITTITITSLPILEIEVYNAQGEALYVLASGVLYSPESNTSDCNQELECLDNLSVSFEGDTIKIWPQDLVSGSYADFIRCNNTTEDQIVLINLSSDDPTIGESIDLFCGNLQDTIYLAIATKNSGSPQYWVLCHVPISIANINSDDCYKNNLSPSDPAICQDVNITAASPELLLGHVNFLEFETTPSVEYTYFNSSYGWEYGQINSEVPLVLACEDYNQTLSLNTSLIIAAPEGPPETPQIVIPNFCSHKINISAESDLCEISVEDGQIEMRVTGPTEDLNPKAFLNNTEILRLGSGLYALESNSLLEKDNIIDFEIPDFPLGLNISTLDLVYMIQALRAKNSFSPHQVIAADIDRSGSLTTKDILTLRKFILGIISTFEGGFLFIADPEEKLSELDELDFNNVYINYQFDKSDIDLSKGLDLFVGAIGNVSLDKRAKTKDLKNINIRYEDQLLQKDQISKVKFTIDSDSKNRMLGFLLGLESHGIDILNVRATRNTSAILSNNTPDEFKISYLDLDHEESIELEFEIKANMTSFLSQALTISPKSNEGVNSELEELQFQLLPERNYPNELKAYPNPTDAELIVDIPTEFVGGSISLSNILGKRIWNEEIREPGQMVISDHNLGPQGILILSIEKNDLRMSKKIITN